MARASAPAMRKAVPLFSTDWLPAVCPSFGVRPVSPEIMVMRSSGRSSSSAAICRSAVRMPCPSSILPVNTVEAPSALLRNHASSRRLVCRLPGSRAGSWARTPLGSSEKATTMPPRAAVKSRREREMVMSGPPCFAGRPQHGGNDPVVRAATAEIVLKGIAHIVLGRSRFGVEQRLGRHDHAIDAVTALRRLLADEGALKRMRLVDRAQAFDRGDRGLSDSTDADRARTRRLALHEDGASAALAEAAAEFWPVELEIVAQNIKQRRVRLGGHRPRHAVDFQTDGHGLLPNDPAVCSAFCRNL